MSDKDNPKFRRSVKSVKSRHYAINELKGRGGVTKLNPKMIEKLGDALSRGHLPKIACASVNITNETFMRWLKKGAADCERLVELVEKGISLRNEDYSLEYDLYEKIQIALYHSQDTPLEALKQASDGGDWRAAAHFLERRFPNDWGKKTQRMVDTKVSGHLETQTIVMVPNQASSLEEWNEAVAAYKEDKLEYLPAADKEEDAKIEKNKTFNIDLLEN